MPGSQQWHSGWRPPGTEPMHATAVASSPWSWSTSTSGQWYATSSPPIGCRAQLIKDARITGKRFAEEDAWNSSYESYGHYRLRDARYTEVGILMEQGVVQLNKLSDERWVVSNFDVCVCGCWHHECAGSRLMEYRRKRRAGAGSAAGQSAPVAAAGSAAGDGAPVALLSMWGGSGGVRACKQGGSS